MSMHTKLSVLAVTSIFLGSPPAQAEDFLQLASDDPFLSDLPVVLTATRLTQSLNDVPGPLTVIDRQIIEASGAINLADLFRLVPGFQVAHVYGHHFSVTAKGNAGSWPRRLLVMIDGRSVYTSLLSTVDWNDLPVELDDIERIEVFRGPNAPAYGANAFTGVINIVTRQPFQDSGFFIKTIAGDINTRYGMLRYAGGQSSDYKQRVTLAYNENSGFGDYVVQPNVRSIDEIVDDSEVGRFSYRGEYTPNSRDVYELHLGYSHSDRETMAWNITDPTEVAMLPQRFYTVDTNYQMLKWERKSSPDNSMYLRFYHNYTNKDDEYLIDDPSVLSAFGLSAPFANAYYHALSERYDLEWQQTHSLADDLRMVWGANLRLDQYKSLYWTGTNETFENNSQRLFANIEYSPGQHQVNAGVMTEKTELADTKTSGRLAYNYHITDSHTLRTSATRGYRIPSLFEKNVFYAPRDSSGNILFIETDFTQIDIAPEKISAYELGYLFQQPDGMMEADLSFYYQDIENATTTFFNNQYTTDPTDQRAEQMNNDGYYENKGAELQLRFHPSRSTLLALNHAYNNVHGRSLDKIDASGTSFYDTYPESAVIAPRHTTSLLLSSKFDYGWAASLAYYYVSKTEWLDLGERIPAYDRIDVRLAKSFKWGGNKGRLELVLQNIGDNYFEFDSMERVGETTANVFETRGFVKFSLQM